MDNVVKKNRIAYVDTIKGIAILCVIIGHMGWDYADRIIYPFHMPLFLICSGYFISRHKEFSCFKKEKEKRLILPYAVICLCVCVLSVLANLVQGMGEKILPDLVRWVYASFYGSCIDYTNPFLIKGIGIIWFLPALFWALLIVKFFGEMKNGVMIIFIIAYMAYVSSEYLWLPFSIQAGAVSAIFVYVGYELSKYDFINKKFNILLFVFAVAVWAFEAWCDIRVNLCDNTIDCGVFSIVGAVIICYALLQIAKLADGVHMVRTPLRFLGKNSMLILGFHEMETYFFPWSIVYSFLAGIGLLGVEADLVVLPLKIFFSIFCTAGTLKIASKHVKKLGFVSA